jgi:hypothetical protein
MSDGNELGEKLCEGVEVGSKVGWGDTVGL